MDIPDACTLPVPERPLRLAEFTELFASAHTIDRTNRTRARVLMRGDADLAERTRRLADAETGCCSFFTFTVTETAPGEVSLDVAVPRKHADVLTGLLELAR